jgi:hypothetical protein
MDARQNQKFLVAVGRVHQLEDEMIDLRTQMAPMVQLLIAMVRKYGTNNEVVVDFQTLEAYDKDNSQLYVTDEQDGVHIRVEVTQRPIPPGERMVEIVPPGGMPPPMPQS